MYAIRSYYEYLPAFHAMLRNSGYAVATLLLRLSLTAPPMVNAAVGVGAGLYALALTYAYDHLYLRSRNQEQAQR